MSKTAIVLSLLVFLSGAAVAYVADSEHTRLKSELDQRMDERNLRCTPAVGTFEFLPEWCFDRDKDYALQSAVSDAEEGRTLGITVALGGPVAIWMLVLLRAALPKLKKGAKAGGQMAMGASRIAADELGKRSARATKDAVGAVAQLSDSAQGRTRECPFCAEMIKPQAKVCKHCGRDLI